MFNNSLPTALMFAATLLFGFLAGSALRHGLQNPDQPSTAEAINLAISQR